MNRVAATLCGVCALSMLAQVAVAQDPAEPQEGMEESSPQMQQTEPPAEGEPPAAGEPEPVAPPSMVAATQPEYEAVVMEYVGGDECVAISDEALTIYRGNVKPNKVWWLVTETGYHWRIRYDASGSNAKSQAAAGDFFSSGTPLNIGCNETGVKSSAPEGVGYRQSWPYKVMVYACENGQPADHLCTKDPQIDWGN